MADEIVVRGSELAAVAAFLDRGAGGLAALVVEGEAGIGKSTVWEAGVEAAASRGWLVRTSRPARSEQGLTLGGLTDLFGDVGDETLGRTPRAATPGARSRAAADRSHRASRRTSGPCRSRSRGCCELLSRGSAGPDRDRRRPVARREHRRDPRLRAAAARRPAGRAARDGADRRRDAGVGRAPRPPSRRIGWNASSSGRCTSRRSTGCSRSGSGGRSRASCWCGSRRRRAATRSMRWSSAARCSGTGSRPTPTGRSPCPTAWARSSPAACRDSRSRPDTRCSSPRPPRSRRSRRWSGRVPGSRPTCSRRSRTNSWSSRMASSGSPTRCSRSRC